MRYLRLNADLTRPLAYASDMHQFVEDVESHPHRRSTVWEMLHPLGEIVSWTDVPGLVAWVRSKQGW